jgi:hypothetical protein
MCDFGFLLAGQRRIAKMDNFGTPMSFPFKHAFSNVIE